MEEYNKLISAKVLDGYEAMIDKVPQATMLGGKRMRKFVLPGSTEYDYPGTLSVGRMDGQRPATLGGEFWKEFGDGFPSKPIKEGGAVWRDPATNEVHSTGRIIPKGMRGGKKITAKSIGKALKPLAPVAKELGMTLAKEGIKEGVKSAVASGGRRRKKGVLHSVGKVLGAVGREVAPVARDIFHEVVVPEGKKALREYIRNSLKSRPSESGEIPMAEAVAVGKGRRKKGGALITNEPKEFHSSVYPPALASYAHSFPKGHDAYGRGRSKKIAPAPSQRSSNDAHEVLSDHRVLRQIENDPRRTPSVLPQSEADRIMNSQTGRALQFLSRSKTGKGRAKLPKSGTKRNSARGAIVAEVMKKHGLSLAEASKYVKEKGLY